MGGFGKKNENEDLSEINIVALVDVLLVILVIFMVASPLSIKGLAVQLPKVSGAGASPQNKIRPKNVVTVDSKGGIFWEEKSYALEALEEGLSVYWSQNSGLKEVHIRADVATPYGKVVDVMAAARRAGAENLGMLAYGNPQK